MIRICIPDLGSRFLLGLALGTITGACHQPGNPVDAGARRPNVLLVSIDTLRADHLGCYGYERDTSPFLDELAAQGTRFESAVVQTLATLPSHTTMLTSLPREIHRADSSAGGTIRGVPEEALLLQEVFRREGYSTVAATGGGSVSRKMGFARGFDRFYGRGRPIGKGRRRLIAMLSELLARGQPIFAFFHTFEVHSPYEPPEHYRGLFGNFESDFEPTSENLLLHQETAHESLSPGDLDYIEAMYDGGIRRTDETIRLLFEDLGRLGFLDHAVVAITSDHGEEFAEHGGLLHRGLLYEELIRVPLIFWGEGIAAGRVEPGTFSSLDLAPSLLSCAGLEIPAEMQGRARICADASGGGEDIIIAQFGEKLFTARTPTWKLIQVLEPPSVELYHLPTDPAEGRNVAPQNLSVVSQLRREILSWRQAQAPRVLTEMPPAQLSEEEKAELRALGYLPPPE